MIAQVGPALPAEVGGAAMLLIGIGVLSVYVVMFGLKHGYDYSLGSLLTKLAQLTGHIWAIGGSLSKSIDAVNHWVEGRLAQALEATETIVAKWWHGMEWIIKATADTLATFGADVHATIEAIVHGTIPNAVHGVTGPLTQALAALRRTVVAQAVAIEHDLGRRARAIEDTLARDFGAAWRGIDHVRGSLAGSIAHLGTVIHGDIAGLRDYAHRNLGRRVKALEGKLAAAAVAAAAITAVTTLFGFLRCTNVQKAGKGLCRMDGSVLDSLLLDTLLIASALSVVEFAKELQAVEHEVVGLMLRGVRETRNLDGL
jgi:hypothetical protein